MSGNNLSIMSCILLMIAATDPAGAAPPLEPLRADSPPIIDGRLDEAVWEAAPSVSAFKTWQPDYGQELPGATEVRLACDDENLYFALRCLDREPSRIKSTVTARDRIEPDDWVCLHLDTFGDQQSRWLFYVNPAGVQMDARAVGDDEDVSIDMVWFSAGRIDDGGYTVEMAIPFKSLRFARAPSVTMGVLFERSVSRTSQRGTWPALDPRLGADFGSQMRPLLLQDIGGYRIFEILPAVTQARGSNHENGELVASDPVTEASVTAKLGLSSDLVLDATFNPDFSQVESDAGQIDFNLRSALYYDEKRPFFLEGREHFTIAGARMGDPLLSLVHTRSIVDPRLGAKLTGKVGTASTMAALYALDEPVDGSPRQQRAHVAALRYKHALDGDGFIGGLATARSFDDTDNQVAGADALLRVGDADRVAVYGFASSSNAGDGTPAATGHALGLSYARATRNWRADLRARDVSADFDTEVGFLNRRGLTQLTSVVTRMLYPGSERVLRLDPTLVNRYIHDKASDRWEHYNAFYFTGVLPRSAFVRVGCATRSEIFAGEKFDTSFLRATAGGQVLKELSINIDYRRSRQIRYVADPYQGHGSLASLSLIAQPTDRLQSGLQYTYADFFRDDGRREYDYTIIRAHCTYQVSRSLFFRAITEYNRFREELVTDLLASFTTIPGTVIHLGYGSQYTRTAWRDGEYVEDDDFLETRRGFFFKASYLWRL